jgi:hypothetical protein
LSYSARFWFWVEEAIDYDLDFNIVKGYTYIDWLGIEIWFTKVIFSDYKLSKEFPSISCMWLSAFVMLSCSLGMWSTYTTETFGCKFMLISFLEF